MSKIFRLKEIFAGSNSGAGGIVENIYSSGNIATNVTQIQFLAESKLCNKSDSFQNLYHSSSTKCKLILFDDEEIC